MTHHAPPLALTTSASVRLPAGPGALRFLLGCAALAFALCMLTGCATSPEERAAVKQIWAERDRERAAECARRGGVYVSGVCASRAGGA